MIRRAVILLLLASALVLLPGATACSFAGPGPDLPARMWVWDLEEARTIDQVDLWTRGLDGDCGLNKAHDLDGDRLVYADRAGDSMGVWLHAIGSDEPPKLVFRLDGYYVDLDLDGDRLSVFMQTEHHDPDRAEPQRHQHIFTVDLQTGDTRRAALDVDWLGNPQIEDGILAWDWVHRGDYEHRLNVYDLRTDEWIYDNVSFSVFGIEMHGRLFSANADWLLLQGDQRSYAIREGQRFVLNVSDSYRGSFDGDLWFRAGYDNSVAVYTLPAGPEKPYPSAPHPAFRESAFDDGRIVLGQYAVDGPSRPPPWIEQDPELAEFPLPEAWRHNPPEDPWFLQLPAPGAALFVAVFVLVAHIAATRRRYR